MKFIIRFSGINVLVTENIHLFDSKVPQWNFIESHKIQVR